MVKDINEVAPKTGVFETATQTQVKKESLLNRKLIVHAYAPMTGADGEYAVMLLAPADQPENLVTTTASSIMLPRLIDVSSKLGLDQEKSTAKEKYYSEPIAVEIVQVQSTTSNRKYFDFKNE